MERTVLYVQENQKVVEKFRTRFEERQIVFFSAATAAEAFEIMSQYEIVILLVDINIPDMRLREMVERCSKEFPMVVLDVCIDILNPNLITKLVNRHRIDKIFVAPWDIDEIIDEIEDSMENAQISMTRRMEENSVIRGEEEFREKLSLMTDSLKKYQYAYKELQPLTRLLLEFAKETGETPDEGHNQFIFTTFQHFLKLQFVESSKMEELEAALRKDFEGMQAFGAKLHIREINSCLACEVKKQQYIRYRYGIYLVVAYACMVMKEVSVTVESQFLSATNAQYFVTLEGRQEREEPILLRYVEEQLLALTEQFTKECSEDSWEWSIS